MVAAVDNDIIFKGACYLLLFDLFKSSKGKTGDVGVLSSARFVVSAKVKTAKLSRDVDIVLGELAAFLNATLALDPTDDEQRLAADLEFAAQELGVPLDAGESQLCAIVAKRAIPMLLTGDKRAVAAMEALLNSQPWLAGVCGKVNCLEQLILALVGRFGAEAVRPAVCAEQAVDKALTFCFGCYSGLTDDGEVVLGLRSYINALRAAAPHVLATDQSIAHEDRVGTDNPGDQSNVHGGFRSSD